MISVKKHIVVETSQQRAFRTFTDGIDRWWPREHHIGKSPLERMIVEPRVGGRWYSICRDGSEVDVGKVVAWEPPGRLVLTSRDRRSGDHRIPSARRLDPPGDHRRSNWPTIHGTRTIGSTPQHKSNRPAA